VLVLSQHACTTSIDVDLSLVDDPRILAIAATPAEAQPGEEVELTALYVDAAGPREGSELSWSLCTARRALAEPGPVATACLDGEGAERIGTAASVTAMLPANACRSFGPDPPEAEPGQPQGRPVEPDHTGGYHQPVVVDANGERSVAGVRLDCGVAGATQAQAAELRRRHRANVPPRVESLARLDGDDVSVLDELTPLPAEPGEAVALRVRWPACAATPHCGDGACTLDENAEACPDECAPGSGCHGAERYAYFDPITLEPADAREAISVAWYANGGTFDAERTGRAADDPSRSSDNVWTAPTTPGDYVLWVVLRDDRGAASWWTLTIEVGP